MIILGWVNPQEGGVFGPRILYSRSTPKTESEIYILTMIPLGT